ncbi:hypothetical protein [Sphingopyxis macrogoltabida]|uniref:Uncharacterized protein n=1 Tax=Sphingopyxis macrogoltabida TaxID=33050 RepID=A0AAC8Z137_SPHMC|nr:hypothetical protein [Sphingopyxis macrogoltabida]ALJ12508.1 hypothetical protein LH19_06480 [Sphingopyxis macrogoltabida]AMU90015.1 hypothetical protein ATM17_13310 [Sphingopyxis macrogoltabida]
MALLKKAAISAAVLSVIAAPIAAAAAPAFDGARATSASKGKNNLDSEWSAALGVLGLIAGVVAIAIVADNNDDPVSP